MTEDIISPADKSGGQKKLPFWIDFKYKHISGLLIFSTLAIGGFALAAFIFDDKRFVFMKPTIMNSLFGVAILGGVWVKKNILKIFIGSAFEWCDWLGEQ